MEEFELEGSAFLSWKIRIPAHNEREAREKAQRVAGWIDIPSSLVRLDAAQHLIRRCQAADSGF